MRASTRFLFLRLRAQFQACIDVLKIACIHIEKEPNATLMVLCDGGTAIKYVTPLESTAYGAYIGWLAEGVKRAIQEGRYILVDPDTPSITDHNLSLRTL